MEKTTPEETIREVVDACTDCDVCRFLMDADCLLFPELYRLYDKEKESGEKITAAELRHLVDLCNFCALCPCPNIRAGVIRAKTEFIDRDGLKFSIRTIEDVERIGRVCGAFPGFSNYLLGNRITGGLLKEAAGIHRDRRFPNIPKEDFDAWADKRDLGIKNRTKNKKKVAYFAGCTGRYLFPEVPRAVVDVLQRNGIEVYYPPQKCCGMPTMLEGDRRLTLKFLRFNLRYLVEAVEDGYDIVCSCPTCAFMLKSVIKEGAYYSRDYQDLVGADETYLKIPAEGSGEDPNAERFVLLQRAIYQNILKDDGFFCSLRPRDRILTAGHTFDLGEYLLRLFRSDDFLVPTGKIPGLTLYYPPCHARELNIGRPYLELLGLAPGLDLESIDGSFYCCGMAGIMGFKKEFHESSLKLGGKLMEKVGQVNPRRIVTECLSCRLQFNQLTRFEVCHPVELIKAAYHNDASG